MCFFFFTAVCVNLWNECVLCNMRTPYSLIYSTHNGDDAPQNFSNKLLKLKYIHHYFFLKFLKKKIKVRLMGWEIWYFTYICSSKFVWGMIVQSYFGFVFPSILHRRWSSIVGIMTSDYVTGWTVQGLNPGRCKRFFSSPTHPHIQWVLGFFPRVKVARACS